MPTSVGAEQGELVLGMGENGIAQRPETGTAYGFLGRLAGNGRRRAVISRLGDAVCPTMTCIKRLARARILERQRLQRRAERGIVGQVGRRLAETAAPSRSGRAI